MKRYFLDIWPFLETASLCNLRLISSYGKILECYKVLYCRFFIFRKRLHLIQKRKVTASTIKIRKSPLCFHPLMTGIQPQVRLLSLPRHPMMIPCLVCSNLTHFVPRSIATSKLDS